MCKWLSDAKLEGEQSPEVLYYKAESLALFKCNSGKFADTVKQDLKNLLTKEMSSVTDYYHTYLVHKDQFQKNLDSKVEGDWHRTFKPENFEFQGSKGLTLDTMRLVELMASNEKTSEKAQQALKTIVKQATSTSLDEQSEN